MRGVPAEEVGKDLPLKNVGKKSMDPVAALQDDAGQGRRCPLKASMTWWGKALPRGHVPLPPPHTSSACAFQLFLFGKNRYAVDIFSDGNQRLSFIQRLVEIDKIQEILPFFLIFSASKRLRTRIK